jgi:hypothetical protein
MGTVQSRLRQEADVIVRAYMTGDTRSVPVMTLGVTGSVNIGQNSLSWMWCSLRSRRSCGLRPRTLPEVGVQTPPWPDL